MQITTQEKKDLNAALKQINDVLGWDFGAFCGDEDLLYHQKASSAAASIDGLIKTATVIP